MTVLISRSSFDEEAKRIFDSIGFKYNDDIIWEFYHWVSSLADDINDVTQISNLCQEYLESDAGVGEGDLPLEGNRLTLNLRIHRMFCRNASLEYLKDRLKEMLDEPLKMDYFNQIIDELEAREKSGEITNQEHNKILVELESN